MPQKLRRARLQMASNKLSWSAVKLDLYDLLRIHYQRCSLIALTATKPPSP